MISRAGNNGFTLIEIIVVLAIISLATSVAVFSAVSYSDKSMIKAETRKVFAVLKHAREAAIARHEEVTFRIKDENAGYSVSSVKGTILDRSLPERIRVYSEDSIIFYPLGDSTGGAVVLQDEDERRYEINVSNITGKAAVKWLQSD